MNNPFWDAMVRSRACAYTAASKFEKAHVGRQPVWCFDRFGQSMTRLPDGRHVEIGGEHEDYYDPDFCIYNDVVVYHTNGTFDIFGYPEADFPPTDFHSASYIAPYIYIIGCLGYPHQRRPGETPIYRLHCEFWTLERIDATGDSPGWIHRHQAKVINGDRIQIEGGKNDCGDQTELLENNRTYIFDPAERSWRIC